MSDANVQKVTEPAAGFASPASACSAARFPRRPERDAEGNAVLYPGAAEYTGVAAIFDDEEIGEFVILAPTEAALIAHVNDLGIGLNFDQSKCRLVKLEKQQNVELTGSGRLHRPESSDRRERG